MGVRIERQKVLLYTLSGLLSGLAGLHFAARINSGEPTAGFSYELTAIAATHSRASNPAIVTRPTSSTPRRRPAR
jgi:ABC-type xylose transport system permease subunit